MFKSYLILILYEAAQKGQLHINQHFLIFNHFMN